MNLQQIFDESNTLREVLSKTGITRYRTLHRLAEEQNIDYTQLKFNYSMWLKNGGASKKRPLSEILIRNSVYKPNDLKNRLVKKELLKNKCAECNISDVYNNKPIVLQLDHINGVRNDNRLDNLRLLCPNCHSQTETFAGKNKTKKGSSRFYTKCKCGNKKFFSSEKCRGCADKAKRKIADRPETAELQEMVELHGYTGTARVLGVSATTIRRWLYKK